MSEVMKLKKEIEATLDSERKQLKRLEKSYDVYDEHNCRGWVEALEYVLRVIDDIQEQNSTSE